VIESPIRQCVGCGARRDKIELIRVVNNKNQISIDPGGNLPGRGAYICPNNRCLEQARKKNELENALKTKLSDDFYQKLVEEINNE
jgi:hypothetical protein